MKTRTRARGGYTLIEVATSVVIVAALTATVLPVVVKQIEDAAPTRLANDLFNIAKGIELFHLNLGPTSYPSDLFQLTAPITTSSAVSGVQLEGGDFNSKDEAAWRGPYITLSVASLDPTPAVLTTGVLSSAFGSTINQTLRLFNSLAPIALDGGGPAEGTGGAENPQLAGDEWGGPGEPDYIALRINNLTAAEFDLLDLLIDGEPGVSTGRLRHTTVSGTEEVVTYFLAVPLSR